MSEEKLEPRIEPHMIPIESSTMKGFSYDEETEQLTITFKNGARYVYGGVPRELVEEFKGSELDFIADISDWPSVPVMFTTNDKAPWAF